MTDSPEAKEPSGLRLYFAVPSTQGFSPYRTGVGLHVALSTLVGGGAYQVATVLAGAPMWAAGLASLALVLALWGVGWRLGVTSHYVFMPAGTVGMVAVALVVTIVGKPAIAPVAAGVLAHLAAWASLSVLTPKQ